MQPLTFVAQPQQLLLLLVVLVLVSQDSRRIQAFPTLVVPPASSRLVPSLSSSSSFVRPIHSSWRSTGLGGPTWIRASPNNWNIDNDDDIVQKDDPGEHTVLFSLAGPYLLAFDRADDTSLSSSTTTQSCRFYQLNELNHDTKDGSDTVLAWSSVQTGHACITGVPACLELQVELTPSDNDDRHQVLLTLHHNLNNKNDEEPVDWNLVQIIARILVQHAVQPWIQEPAESSSSSSSSTAAGTQWTVSWTASSTNPGDLSSSLSSSFAVSRDTWVADLYHGIWNVTDTTEMAELVDATGRPLGHVPRQLVHSYNLLHRGIGVLVYRRPSSPTTTELDDDNDKDLTQSLSQWQFYVHQRTATKRLFPSLYDMFVGGVSLATEEARVTAEREVAEELGLQHGSMRLHAWPGLDEPCLVRTAVNRCVVTLFGYPTTATTTTAQQQQEDDNDDEIIVWQPEEVAWGAFVPYPVVHASAQQSVQRLVQTHHWPGRRNQGLAAVQRAEPNHPQQSFFNDDKDNDSNSPDWPASWQEWDYVPDGLLVWEAWLEWLEHSTKTNINNKNQLLSS